MKHEFRMKYLNIKKALAAWHNIQPLSEKDRERLSQAASAFFMLRYFIRNSCYFRTKLIINSEKGCIYITFFVFCEALI